MKTIASLICLVTYLTCTCAMREWPIAIDMACSKALSVVACTFEFTNMAAEDYYILTSDSPLEGLYSPFVAVYHNGRHVQYEGLIGFRLPPRKQDFQLIKAGQVISATVQISDAFTFGSDGLYTIRYNKPLKFITGKEMEYEAYVSGITSRIERVRVSEVRESVYIDLMDTHLLTRPVRMEAVLSAQKPDHIVHIDSCGSAQYIGGTSQQQSDTTKAHKLLCDKLQKAYDAVGNNDLYKTWFGIYDGGRATTVKSIYKKSKDGLTNTDVTYDFKNGLDICKARNWRAFTYDDSKTVWLCGPYGYDSITTYCTTNGAYSKEHVLAHEWSHAFGHTNDYADGYGAENCKNLAKKNPPTEAIDNADNYAFYYCYNGATSFEFDF
ncbi:PREDICTED: uncharacterized protein LOC109581005 [Amphimedon queenslandica]|uniref:Lysine-specific metallo-endopeptidase domain-containing protein n=1 Tax=Amphimedon queenslandica TaxID=400682 RepID=A0A1X7V846_AMPQE|nr:PREDICTED: uncharacterized protein LOC109581005 [Amphimedon queenslandica]|eukprot:XP_019850269.1 PREDICTED: uncharacterized protein LOC109581005 [Amphimedon queenslandica]